MNFWDIVGPLQSSKWNIPGGLNPGKAFAQFSGEMPYENPLANKGMENLREGRWNKDTFKGVARAGGETFFGRDVANWVDTNILKDNLSGPTPTLTAPGGLTEQQKQLYQQMLLAGMNK